MFPEGRGVRCGRSPEWAEGIRRARGRGLAIGEKGARLITVDGVGYRRRVRRRPTYSQALCWSPCTYAVTLAENAGATLVVTTDQPHAGNWFGRPARPVLPSAVADAIRRALAGGWDPHAPGAPFPLDLSEGFTAPPQDPRPPREASTAPAEVPTGGRPHPDIRNSLIAISPITNTGVAVDAVVRAWVDGWVVSRGAAPPVEEPWGCTIDMGMAQHVTRHVFGTTNDEVEEAAVRKVAGAVTGAGTWLKVFAAPSTVTPWLGEGWWVDPEPGYLMSVRLRSHEAPAAVPDGYRLRTWSRGGVTRVMVAAPDGSLAARGQIAPTGATAVVDQIETSPDHRRRGLGTLVMRTLTHTALDQGAEVGVLGGTPDGRALYESLGWGWWRR